MKMRKKVKAPEGEEEALKPFYAGGGYYLDYVPGHKLSRVTYGRFLLTYHPDHDERYAHIPPEERWKYPDEVREEGFLPAIYIREKTYEELGDEIDTDLALHLTGGGTEWREKMEKYLGRPFPNRYPLQGITRLLFSKDRPITDAWNFIHWVR